MSDKLLVDNNTHELKLGNSFDPNGQLAFHSIRYDFKPASVDTSKVSSVEIGENNSVSLTVPHVAGSGSSHAVYKGNKRPNQKECVLIIDHKTGEFRLEKLASTLQLKKTRIEGSSRAAQQASRPVTPVEQMKKSKDSKSSPTNRQPTSSSQKSSHSNGLKSHHPSQEPFRELNHLSPSTRMSPLGLPKMSPIDATSASVVETMSDNSSASSSDDSSSDSESDTDTRPKGHTNRTEPDLHRRHSPSRKPTFTSTLCEDLQLSESGSESD